MFNELTPKLKEYIDYMFLTELENLKKAYDSSYEKIVYEKPDEIVIRGYPLIYKEYILEKIAEMDEEI